MKTITSKLALIFALIFATSLLACAQDMIKKDEMKKDEMKKDSMMNESMPKEDMRPIVAIFRADWCPYCKKLEPTMMDLMKAYGEKLNFVVFDITNEITTAESKTIAKEKGLEDFFNENKGKSAFVVIFKEGKRVFAAKYDTKRETYVKAFDEVLK